MIARHYTIEQIGEDGNWYVRAQAHDYRTIQRLAQESGYFRMDHNRWRMGVRTLPVAGTEAGGVK